MHNLISPCYARRQAKQRLCYSLIAVACVILAALQFYYALRTAPVTASVADTIEPSPSAAPLLTTAPVVSAEASSATEAVQNTVFSDPCANLEAPNKQISAVLWQPHASKLILKANSGRHINITIGETLEHSSWVLQRIDNHSITWLHQDLFCHAEQAIKTLI